MSGMNNLITGIGATQLGPSLEATANDWSHSADLQAQLENQKAISDNSLNERKEYANMLFNSRENVAQIQASAREQVESMKHQLANSQSLDPNTPEGMSSMAQSIAAKTGYDPQEVNGMLTNFRNGTMGSAQLPPDLQSAYNQELQARTYGPNLEKIGAGLKDTNAATAGGALAQATQGSTNPNQVDATSIALQGHPLVSGSGNGPISTSGADADMNNDAAANAETAANAKETTAEKPPAAATNQDAANKRAALSQATGRIKELDQKITQISSQQLGNRPLPANQQAALDSFRSERQQLARQADSLTRELSGDHSAPSSVSAPSVPPPKGFTSL